jgi:serine/threonine protein kinase/formylglycine-generating enzyme required for sulfatase activity
LGGSGTRSGSGDVELSTLPGEATASTLELGEGLAAPPAAVAEEGDAEGGAAADLLARGSAVGRYLVLERLGAGAMGVVYAAYDPELDRKIALKLLRRQQETAERGTRRQARMVREAKAIARVSHPNVVGIFDVGVHEGQVFMAMEHLTGGTLKSWLAAKKRTWREILAMFIEVGRGMAGAHGEGLIHRDFKPDNVLLDKNGVPKVVDFGLVRMAADTEVMAAVAPDALDPEASKEGALPLQADAALTRTGALTGTPVYMAPEQFRAEAADARSDQFSFCVALYEALYGERPFPGDNLLALADAVVNGRVREAPKATDVPGWVRKAVLCGLSVERDRRFAGFDELNAVLANDPIARRRRQILIGAGLVVVIGGLVGGRNAFLARHREIDRQVAEHVTAADTLLKAAAAKKAEAKALRAEALNAFDTFRREKGEDVWERGLAAAHASDTGYERAIQRLEAAVNLDPRRDLKRRIADALVDYAESEGRTAAERESALRRLAPYDEGGERSERLKSPATLRLETTPPGLTARLETYDPSGHHVSQPARLVGRTPIELRVGAGSYRVTFDESATHVGFYYPVLLAAGERHVASLRVPARSSVPKNYVFVPDGSSLFGSDDEEIRAIFFETIPLHAVATRAFLISRYETTIGDWIEYLKALTPAQREARRPHGGRDAVSGFIDVKETPAGGWELAFRSTDRTYRAKQGQPFAYEDRDRRASLDWFRFPVTGITPEDARDYAAWLDRSGRVPGARLCTEREWERGARGADARRFPHGDKLLPDDANFDLTYGRKNGAYGPDEVGSHPSSLSPFGLYDMVGNAWEITSSVLDSGQYVARGSSFYMCLKTLLSVNRDPISSVTRDYTIGLRMCADAPL